MRRVIPHANKAKKQSQIHIQDENNGLDPSLKVLRKMLRAYACDDLKKKVNDDENGKCIVKETLFVQLADLLQIEIDTNRQICIHQ